VGEGVCVRVYMSVWVRAWVWVWVWVWVDDCDHNC
jgi:hypothetical protein